MQVVCKFASMKIYKYASMQICKYSNHTLVWPKGEKAGSSCMDLISIKICCIKFSNKRNTDYFDSHQSLPNTEYGLN